MSSFILKFFAGILTALVAHRLISIIFTAIIGFVIYLAFANPKLLVEIFDKLKELVGFSSGSMPDAKMLKSLVK